MWFPPVMIVWLALYGSKGWCRYCWRSL